jgi:metal-dependent amidase/aminoacylase/carboxypeptidase family protein
MTDLRPLVRSQRGFIIHVRRELHQIPEPTMGEEGMSFFLQRAKGCFFFLGVGRPGCAPLHNAKFDFNIETLLLGVEIYCRIVLDLLADP